MQAQQPGAPLSSHEYRRFFRALRVAHHAATACHLRALYGCQNPLVRRLDEYENHGVIPKGKASCNCQGLSLDSEVAAGGTSALEFLTKAVSSFASS